MRNTVQEWGQRWERTLDCPRGRRGGGGGCLERRWMPGELRASPKALPERPRDPPRSAKGAPRVAQGHPRSPTSTPKRVKSRPEHTQDRFEADFCREPHSKAMFNRFSTDFPPKSFAETTGESMVNCVERLRRSGHRSTKRCCQNHRFT